MNESHELSLVIAICEDQSIHCFGTFSESIVGDDIIGFNKIGATYGSYLFTPENENCCGCVSVIPDSISLLAYLNGQHNPEFDSICKILDIKTKIKEFYWLCTDLCYSNGYIALWKITKNNIELQNHEEKSFLPMAIDKLAEHLTTTDTASNIPFPSVDEETREFLLEIANDFVKSKVFAKIFYDEITFDIEKFESVGFYMVRAILRKNIEEFLTAISETVKKIKFSA